MVKEETCSGRRVLSGWMGGAALVTLCVGCAGGGGSGGLNGSSGAAVLGSPSFLPVSAVPSASRSLPFMATAPSGTASLPWRLVGGDQGSKVLTVEVLFGGCTSAPEGFTVSVVSGGVVVTVVAEVHSAVGCAAVGGAGLYFVALPSGDVGLGLEHGVVHNWD